MLRMRRYRIFLIFAVFVIAALYHFRNFGDLENAGGASVDGLRDFGLESEKEETTLSSPDPAAVESEENTPQQEEGQNKGALEKEAQDLLYDDTSSSNAPSEVLSTITPSSPATQIKVATSPITNAPSTISDKGLMQKPTGIETDQDDAIGSQAGSSSDSALDDQNEEQSEGRQDIDADILPTTIHWSRLPEHFPVPSASIIQLPTGKPKAIPTIQHVFSDESANDKIDREQKLDSIKKTFAHSWAGYREKAWMQDELSPVSGNNRNPFCGWAATLVDSLDSLWIFGMKEEFEEAANALRDIDFTTTDRVDIPLFETVIRYLGGLIAAHDLSGGTYRILLDKAVELAEILMGAFDTPNRMPMTFYLWKPTFASQPHRARTRVVLAELGSLSVEFTRLAQITREPKYYDAVARITNELEILQNNTKMPGLWPLSLDASGCKKPDLSSTSQINHSSLNGPGAESGQASNSSTSESNAVDVDIPSNALNAKTSKTGTMEASTSSQKHTTQSETLTPKPTVENLSKSNAGISKRQFSDEDIITSTSDSENETEKQPDCEPQGLASPPGSGTEEFTLGGMADSVYEYLPKQYILLGGLEGVYQRMYEAAMETTKAHLLFRPMLQDDRNILLSGAVKTSGQLDDPLKTVLRPEGTHLTCFAGGMFALGAKIFKRDGDMEIAKKLTDGCVWAYEATATGIMPEHYLAVPCKSQERCAWNETLYHEALDPHREAREETRKAQQQQILLSETQRGTLEEESDKTVEDKIIEKFKSNHTAPISNSASIVKTTSAVDVASAAETIVPEREGELYSKLEKFKRQLGDIESEVPLKPADDIVGTPTREDVPEAEVEAVPLNGNDEKKIENSKNSTEESELETSPEPEPIPNWTDYLTDPGDTAYTPERIPSPEEFIKNKIRDERLPTGMTKITGSRYILRPEAIESVFMMYRITGDNYWREKGWTMFQAIQKHTNATYGASAIADVTQKVATAEDEMESFWLAETLKYFFLLFSDPGVISLDQYVFNTEAHPFRRPRAA